MPRPIPMPQPAPAPSKPEAVPAAPDSTGSFGWMVAAFRERAQADALAARARKSTLPAQVVTDTPPQGMPVYRVIVGRYASESDAKRERYKAQALTRGPVRLTPLDSEPTP